MGIRAVEREEAGGDRTRIWVEPTGGRTFFSWAGSCGDRGWWPASYPQKVIPPGKDSNVGLSKVERKEVTKISGDVPEAPGTRTALKVGCTQG